MRELAPSSSRASLGMDLSEACILIKDNSTSVLPLPDAFLEFLEENGLDSSIYVGLDTIPRYIRLKPGYEWQLTEIETELDCKLEAVDWLPGFFFIPSHIQIAGTKAYRSGKIYGMDAASGAAVMTLNVTCGDHVLDLCAAPGAKLCMLADLLGNSGTITGVDVARHRLAACRTMLQKYELGDRCRLFVADGSTFSLVPTRYHTDVKMCPTDGKDVENTFREWTSKKTWTNRKNAAKRKMANSVHTPLEPSEPDLIFYGRDSGVVGMQRSKVFHILDATESSSSGYDKVLVDAECTHDGSIKHIQKFEYWGWSTFQRRVLDPNRMQNLTCLQLALLTNGFRLLKIGGSLVYSTCSLTVAQNEAVVEQFLSRNPSAELMKVDSAETWRCRSGGIPLTLRFDPKTSQTSGMFIAKFTKNPS
ncbi:uncharacterized protein LOC110114712 isoform X2 [Dendrobium catenatum]|uniref:Multisite-specific tRNA:(Cytosine-C5)-methyltransferase n=1 Tax=Dendrobium catenatum TaxID=906689 RepID=A0A2I0XHL3_9ASPA|nr:uncharacterized protein LOC110114712 isoform X2 [Dendrobium catenatum]PKU87401.1 multisite-specific tRNA:(cytosine-C5)-methyltransferase [Dendrobium catenatum]